MTLPLSLLLVHFIGDFVLQSDWMAVNKSKRNEVLTIHALVYSLCFLLWGWKFWLLTFYSHWATDWVTSRITSRLWFFRSFGKWFVASEGEFEVFVPTVPNYRHWFFVAIGADQLIHAATLAATWSLLR